jgi:hypothetical protein
MTNSERYLFVHVPKTGGTSLLHVFRSILGPQAVSPAIGAHFDEIDVPAIAAYRMIVGHFRFDQIRHFPGRRLLTFLRDPVDMVLSKYYFYRASDEIHHPDIALCHRHTLEELLERGGMETRFLRNCYVRQFAATAPAIDIPGGADLKLAAERLASCDFVGLLAELADAMDLMSYTFAWPPVNAVPESNVTSKRKSVAELGRDIVRKIESQNELDRELYRYAVNLFGERRRAMMRTAVILKSSGAVETQPCPQPAFETKLSAQRPALVGESGASSRIVSLAVRKAGGGSNEAIYPGDRIEIAAKLVSNESVSGLGLSILIHNRYSQLVCCIDSERYSHLDTAPGGIYVATVALNMKLKPGTYTVSAELARAPNSSQGADRANLIQTLDKVTSFQIDAGEWNGRRGLVDLADGVTFEPDSQQAPTYQVGTPMSFQSGGSARSYLCSGWGEPEDWGCWTTAREADLLFSMDGSASDLRMTVALLPFSPLPESPLKVDVIVNGQLLATWLFSKSLEMQFRELLIPPPGLGAFMHILFRISEPRVPAELGISSDIRSLGLGFVSLKLEKVEARDDAARTPVHANIPMRSISK